MADILSPWLIRYGPNSNPSVRLFCFHCAGGSASNFRDWPAGLPSTIELLAVQLPGREGRANEKFIEAIGKLTSEIAEAMTPHLGMPYVVFGHSFGTLVAFEVIRELRKRGLPQPFLFIPAGREAPHLEDPRKPISELPDDAFVEELIKDYGDHAAPVLQSADLREAFVPQIRADFAVSEAYCHKPSPPLDCPIIAIAGVDEDDIRKDDLEAWAVHTNRGFSSRRFPGDHFFVTTSGQLVAQAVSREVSRFRTT